MAAARTNAPLVEVCILAGGLSARMGRDKARLRLGGKTLLTHIQAAVAPLNCPTRVVRRDMVPRCGPMGGVYTALKTSPARSVLFLSCDMPFVPISLLRRIRRALGPKTLAVFVRHEGIAGFPFLLRVQALPEVEELLRQRNLALHELEEILKARAVRPTRGESRFLLNVNTPEDWTEAKRLWTSLQGEAGGG
ncbi:MAG: molybdenum cofactor guanylyltransferase [Verrucomicrobia bacterium]|nr:molybdenum cofactor guanylyltransferase [Verrucomicrobiota bacterium]